VRRNEKGTHTKKIHCFICRSCVICGKAADHASVLVEIAEAVRNSILSIGEDNETIAKNSKRARTWESKADVMVKEVCTLTRRPNVPRVFEQIIMRADDAADHLEERFC
jgi:hypothetical protein